MPQPDNRREQGGITQATQQTVAPTGQMAASISPISGGAAAAAPVLQIGQQAQIQQTGAELYQALAGVAQGIAQGAQNFEKMYNLVSETDYAEFETAYLTEHDRVKGDPTKLKVWMDSQTYKPNRVTAKRYHGLRAQINGKAYEEDQNDMWMADLNKISMMNTTDGLDYLRQRIDQHDPNSPYAKQAERKMIELQSQVATSVHNVNMQGMFLSYQEDNVRLTEQLKTNPSFAQSLDNPAYELILANRALGLATVDPATGMVQLKSGEVFDLNSVTAESMAALQNNIGEFADPQLAMQAYRAAKLPAGVVGRQQSSGNAFQTVGDLTQLLRGTDPAKNVRNYLLNELSSGPENAPNMARSLMAVSQVIAGDDNLPPAEKARLLTELREIVSFDNDASSEVWAQYGIESEEQFNALFGTDALARLDDIIDTARLQAMSAGFQAIETGAGTALSTGEVRRAFNFGFDSYILPQLAQMDSDARILTYNPQTGDIHKVTLGEYEAVRNSSDYMPGGVAYDYIVAGVEMVDSQFSPDVPFMFAMDPETGGFVYTGGGSPKATAAMSDTIERLSEHWQAAKDVEDYMTNPGLPFERAQNAMIRLFEVNPRQAAAMLARPTQTRADAFPSGASGDPAFEAWDKAFNPDALAAGDQEFRALAKAAVDHSEGLQQRILERYGELGVTAFRYGSLVNPNEDFASQIATIHGVRTSNEWNSLTAATNKLEQDILEVISGIEMGLDIDPVAAMAPAEEATTTEAAWRNMALERINLDYSTTHNGVELVDALQSQDNQTLADARAFVQNAAREITRDSRLVGVSEPASLLRQLRSTPTTTDQMVTNANDLYAPGQFNMTAEAQGALAFIDALEQTMAEEEGGLDYDNLAGSLGLTSQSELEAFRSYVQTGLARTPATAQRFNALRGILEAGVTVTPVSSPPGVRRAVQRDGEEGPAYQEFEFLVQINPDIIRERTMSKDWMKAASVTGNPLLMGQAYVLDWLSAPNVAEFGLTQEMFDRIAGRGKDIVIRRQRFHSAVPDGRQTGSEILRDRKPKTYPHNPKYPYFHY